MPRELTWNLGSFVVTNLEDLVDKDGFFCEGINEVHSEAIVNYICCGEEMVTLRGR